MDEELANVQAQIGRLEPQIEAAGESFLFAFESGNQFLAEYWQKKEEQLRKKKLQLWKEELLLLKSNLRGSAPAPPPAGLRPAEIDVPDKIAWAKKLNENLTGH
ncbi:uncharacterized protein LOC112350405 [Selaginella moellendorffii]|uniref:uncharacterized protein LOC112350405 n=1 Tax=Selaginella moellendorffii TaxID=88036 RepID=UPI000D1C9ED0|nr:uncharacterized protein LOC112350405 [Selaginella moellendorffii]|eukprot:XP_024542348.1 uncharacterized protein LOC112350405 [Selaginella moellendorffii]